MKIEQVYEEIERLDNSEFIELLNYQGINLWPLLRYHLLLKFKDGEAYLNSTSNHKLKNLSWWEKLKLKRHIISNRRKFENNSSDILFWDERRYNTDKVNGEIYNRHIQPYLELVNEFSKAKLFTVDEKLQGKLDILYLNPWFFILSQSSIDLFDVNVLRKHDIIINFDAFLDQSIMIVKWKNYFLNLFKNKRPKLIFIACFYDPMNFGLISACHEYGIKTVDIQHGKQGKYHLIYYGWNYFPETGFSILPDYFWVWGEYFQKIISDGVTNNKFPKVIVGGNAWLMKEKESKFDLNSLPKKFLEHKTKTILFALQPIETEYMIAFIKKTAAFSTDINIVLRFHPVMQKDKIIYESELKNLNNVDLEIGNNLKLVELFRFCDAVVSAWSTVVLEAVEFGLKSYIVHPNGKSIFLNDINLGRLFYFDEPFKLVNHLNIDKSKSNGVINTSREAIIDSLKQICA